MAKKEFSKARFEAAKMQLNTLRMEHAIKVFNKYDAVDSSNAKKRKAPKLEQGGEDAILTANERSNAYVMCRDLERNNPDAKSMLVQLKNNIVGAVGGKCYIRDNKDASDYFNTWAKSCEFRQGLHLQEVLELIVACKYRDGDALVVFDDFIEKSGKIFVFESDQLVKIKDAGFKSSKYGAKYNQPAPGIIADKFGRVAYYTVSSVCGLSEIAITDDRLTIIPAASARLYKQTTRPNQLRGVGSMMTSAAILQDIYEMYMKELQTAKVQSSIAGVVKKKNNAVASIIENEDMTSADAIDLLGGNAPRSGNTGSAIMYDNFEALTGGFMEYLDSMDDFELLDFKRPQAAFAEFVKSATIRAGAALGLSKTYSTLTTDSSYTAFRGDLLMSWVTFATEQKRLERTVLDWLASKVLEFGGFDPSLRAVWLWPTMPQVDPEKDTRANLLKMKNGLVGYADVMGANWEESVAENAASVDYARQQGLNLDADETVSGAIATKELEQTQNNNEVQA